MRSRILRRFKVAGAVKRSLPGVLPNPAPLLPCPASLLPKRPAPDSSSTSRSDESKSSSQSVKYPISVGQVINLQDFSFEDQMKLSNEIKK